MTRNPAPRPRPEVPVSEFWNPRRHPIVVDRRAWIVLWLIVWISAIAEVLRVVADVLT